MFQHRHAPPAPGRFDGTHQASRARADDHDVVVIVQRSAFSSVRCWPDGVVGIAMVHVPQFNEWPKWVQEAVVIPNAVLLVVLNLWWPKNKQGWRRFGLGCAWLIVFLLVMYFVFGMKKW
jgi:hypothetical protein